jgi:hypothetical protein
VGGWRAVEGNGHALMCVCVCVCVRGGFKNEPPKLSSTTGRSDACPIHSRDGWGAGGGSGRPTPSRWLSAFGSAAHASTTRDRARHWRPASPLALPAGLGVRGVSGGWVGSAEKRIMKALEHDYRGQTGRAARGWFSQCRADCKPGTQARLQCRGPQRACPQRTQRTSRGQPGRIEGPPRVARQRRVQRLQRLPRQRAGGGKGQGQPHGGAARKAQRDAVAHSILKGGARFARPAGTACVSARVGAGSKVGSAAKQAAPPRGWRRRHVADLTGSCACCRHVPGAFTL